MNVFRGESAGIPPEFRLANNLASMAHSVLNGSDKKSGEEEIENGFVSRAGRAAEAKSPARFGSANWFSYSDAQAPVALFEKLEKQAEPEASVLKLCAVRKHRKNSGARKRTRATESPRTNPNSTQSLTPLSFGVALALRFGLSLGPRRNFKTRKRGFGRFACASG